MNKRHPVKCSNRGPCFGIGFDGGCTVLASPYEGKGACPFQKPDRYVTKKKVYPYNGDYGKGDEE